MKTALQLLVSLVLPVSVLAADNVVTNGGFEQGMTGWKSWARDAKAIAVSLDQTKPHTGRTALRIEHTAAQDWSVEPTQRLAVRAGDLIELECWVQLRGAGNATLCAATYDSAGKAVAWSAGERSVTESTNWTRLKTRFVVAANVVQVQPRLIGHGASVVLLDDYSAARGQNLFAMRAQAVPPVLTLNNAALDVEFHTTNNTFVVRDRRANYVWRQTPLSADLILKNAVEKNGRLEITLYEGGSGLDLAVSAELDHDLPEVKIAMAADGELPGSIRFPNPFVGQAGDYLVVPMNEGISYPVDDPTIKPMRLVAYGGHGICMAFWGVTDGTKGQMAILETPDDVSININRAEGNLFIAPEWQSQLGRYGYTRLLRYVFLDKGGHVAIAKRYRAHAKQTGLLKTLAEKRAENPNVDLLIGAVNVWCWESDSVGIVRDMQAAGIDRILWSNRGTGEKISAMNELGVLTSRYDIYQDAMNKENFPRLRYIHADWTTNAWPNDIIIDRYGKPLKGWEVETKDGAMVPCGVICDKQALPYAQERVPADLATHPYRSRFIDTTTAAPWNECYSPRHLMTRSESKRAKMRLLEYMSKDSKLVTGCETGHDASVPYLHYFEGMLSLGPYRVPDSGRRMSVIWTNVPENVAKFQLGQAYRLPLWELVYHDCVVAQWYWGDYNNKLPALWTKRDLFNALYGAGTMFMFDRKLWNAEKARFVQSYRDTCPVIRKVGYQEMTDHRFLTRDRNVQQTEFANGTVITANFGETAFTLPNGPTLKPLSYHVAQGRR